MARIIVLLGQPGGIECEPARRLDLYIGVGDHPLNGLALGNWLAHRHALFGIVNRHLQRALSDADGATSDSPATGTNPLHAQVKAAIQFTQNILLWHAHILEIE